MKIFKSSQAALVEIIFIAILISTISGYLIATNNNEQQISQLNPTQPNLGIHNSLLNSDSSLYIQNLVQNEIPLFDPNWDLAFETLNSIHKGNLLLLDSGMNIIDSRESCTLTSLNTKLFTIPIILYNSTTQEINDINLLQYEICRP